MDETFSFWKIHGAGNDFVMFDGRYGLPFSLEDNAKRITDRHFGVGGDGVISLEVSKIADFRMRYVNANGLSAICGNGLRCVARYVVENELVPATSKSFEIETDYGTFSVIVLEKGKRVTVNMGEPVFHGADIPVRGEGVQLDIPLQLGGEEVVISAVGFKNPHCVLFVDDVENSDVARLGPLLEHHSFFPKKTNVEFVQVVGEHSLKLRVWERGVGETLSCGTGICAALVVAAQTGRTSRHCMVTTRGGEFEVVWDKSSAGTKLTGPTEVVYRGELSASFFR